MGLGPMMSSQADAGEEGVPSGQRGGKDGVSGYLPGSAFSAACDAVEAWAGSRRGDAFSP